MSFPDPPPIGVGVGVMVGVGLGVWVAVGEGVKVSVGRDVNVGTAGTAGVQDVRTNTRAIRAAKVLI